MDLNRRYRTFPSRRLPGLADDNVRRLKFPTYAVRVRYGHHDLGRRLVFPEPEIDSMPRTALPGLGCEADLGHEFRLNPADLPIRSLTRNHEGGWTDCTQAIKPLPERHEFGIREP